MTSLSRSQYPTLDLVPHELSLPPVPNTVTKYSLNIAKMPRSIYNGVGSPDLKLVGMQNETLKKQQQFGATRDESESNPFKLQKNFEGILVNRERDRFLSKIQKDAHLRGPINPS